jgi:hypothetical protein
MTDRKVVELDDGLKLLGNTPPPSGTPVPAAAQANNTPAKTARSLKLLPIFIGVMYVGLFGMLLLGVLGVALPTDSVFRTIGGSAVDFSDNSLTTLGYALVLMMIASAVVGNALGRARNK